MNFKEITNIFKKVGVIPVVKMDDPEHAVPLARALMRGGVEAIEITFRSAAAEESIRRISNEVPDILTGAGTVLNNQNAQQAISAGANFLVSPGFNPELARFSAEKKVSYFPGVNDPTATEQAIAMGFEVLKFFPAEASGGCKMLKSLKGPYQNIQYIPTGGINVANLNDYLSLPNVMAIGGSWLVKPELIQVEAYDEIERLASEAIELVLGFEFSHVGINLNNEQEALDLSTKTQQIFHFSQKIGNSSVFSSREFEWMKSPGLGRNGHIAIQTNNIIGAVHYLKKRGIQFKEETRKEKNGELKIIYLDGDFGGFAFHLVQK